MQIRSGIWTALVTPFNQDGTVDLAAFKNLVQRQLDAEIHALVPCGTTGESATLRDAEKIELVKICVEMARGKVPVIAGAGHNDTRQAIETHRKMKDAGADAALHVTPFYNKPTQEGLFRHYEAISESSDLPIVLYNVPSRTGVDLLPSTTLRLAREFANIVAIKETSTDLPRMQNMITQLQEIRPEFLVLSGEDAFLLPILSLGGAGLVSVGSNFAPQIFCEVFNEAALGNQSVAQSGFEKIKSLTSLMFTLSNPLPVKTALSFLGLLHNVFRLPLCPMSQDEATQLKAELTQQGWL